MSCALFSGSKRHVCYYYSHDVANFHYGPNHPMKPHRLALTHSLILNYGLLPKMDVYKPRMATDEDFLQFHTKDYLDYLKKVTPEVNSDQFAEFSIHGDCPPFKSVYEFCQLYTGGSIEGAWRLNQRQNDVSINWSGGLHHARKSEGSGFCYVNDIVLGIIELLRYHPRVLYVDIDIHHGDGVQDAFYHTDRVMTVSFHKYAQGFFPGTGSLQEVGHKSGKYYSVNVPLRDGIDDKSYLGIFKPVISDVMEIYAPSAVVIQCGADSLRGDRIGNFNLSLAGHAECLRYVASYNLPMLVVGGGGYTIRNVARCWANETGVLLDVELPFELPENDYYAHYAPDYKLQTTGIESENLNTRNYLDNVLTSVRKNLRMIQCAPSVQMQVIPPSIYDFMSEGDEEQESEMGSR
ncbi:histone deacetylase B-like [Schistocerca gregaria]|uniref:histone deacetylase B-like n=1 Tax=Schistocerca gregaria TaxID=7010 RepID=UPI00211EB3FF|nr:histone deacetylase B-like [Schistocerca gregaria]